MRSIPPKAEANWLKRVDDGMRIAGLIDDIRNHPIEDGNKKEQLLCYTLVLFEVLRWETFIEDLVEEGQEFILKHVDDPLKLPFEILLPLSEELSIQKDKRSIWSIAGNGWKDALRKRRKRLIDGFHTPRPSNVDNLIETTLGMKNHSASWRWKKCTNEQVCRRLNDLITLRGSIAHSMIKIPKFRYATFSRRFMFLYRARLRSANAIRTHVAQITGQFPWGEASL